MTTSRRSKKNLDEEIGDCFHTLKIRGISPLQHGHALEKKRVLIVGVRQDQVCRNALTNSFNRLIEHPPSSRTHILDLPGLPTYS